MNRKTRFCIACFALVCAILGVLILASQSFAHIRVHVHKGDSAWLIEKKQLINLKHARHESHPRKAKGPERHPSYYRWHRLAAHWILREHRELEERYIAPWLPTKNCEAPNAGWWADTGNGFYGGVQFDHDTWKNHGGKQFAYNANGATKIQQITIAWRLTYDGWPNCPNP